LVGFEKFLITYVFSTNLAHVIKVKVINSACGHYGIRALQCTNVRHAIFGQQFALSCLISIDLSPADLCHPLQTENADLARIALNQKEERLA